MQSRLLSFLLLKTCAVQLWFGEGENWVVGMCLLCSPSSATVSCAESKETASVIKERERKNERAQLCEGVSPPCCLLQFMGRA